MIKKGSGLVLVFLVVGSTLVFCPPMFSQQARSVIDSPIAVAQKELETLQMEAYSRNGGFPKQYSRSELETVQRKSDERLLVALSRFPGVSKADIERLRREIAMQREALGQISLPTKYENRLAYETIIIVADQIDRKVEEFRKAHPLPLSPVPSRSQIVFGTLPTGQIEVGTSTINGRERDKSKQVFLVTFESGLLRFMEVLSDLIVRALPTGGATGPYLTINMDRSAIEKHLDLNPEVVQDFEDVMQAYLLKGGPYLSTTFREKEVLEPKATFAAFLYRAGLLFTLGHEYGHIIFRQNTFLSIDPRWPRGWSEEYFADGWGTTLSLMAAGSRTGLSVTVLGARFFFLCFDLIERGISIIQTGQDTYRATTDHPPSYRRAERIPRYVLAALRDFWNLEPESISEFNELIDSSEGLDRVVDVLWERIKPILSKLHNERVSLAPSWSGIRIPQG